MLILHSQKKWPLYVGDFLNIFVLRTNNLITSSLDVAFSLQIEVDHF